MFHKRSSSTPTRLQYAWRRKTRVAYRSGPPHLNPHECVATIGSGPPDLDPPAVRFKKQAVSKKSQISNPSNADLETQPQ